LRRSAVIADFFTSWPTILASRLSKVETACFKQFSKSSPLAAFFCYRDALNFEFSESIIGAATRAKSVAAQDVIEATAYSAGKFILLGLLGVKEGILATIRCYFFANLVDMEDAFFTLFQARDDLGESL
jgi:hypothetical protein